MKWFNLSDNVNLLSIIGAIAIILLTVVIVGIYIKQMKEKKTEAELVETDWDGIGEYKNPLPIGWAIMFIVLIFWAIWYFLVGYPLNSYSQIGEYNEEVSEANVKFTSKYANADKDTLLAMGEGIYLVQCSPCHGILGNGMEGKAQDLTFWGSEKHLAHNALHGSFGMNYPLGIMSTEGLINNMDEANAVAAYVAKEISAIKHSNASDEILAKGKELFEATCTACHGMDGKGMEGMAPDLTKYGSSEFVIEVLNRGKAGSIGVMPTFIDGRLNDVQKKAVGEYIMSLSK